MKKINIKNFALVFIMLIVIGFSGCNNDATNTSDSGINVYFINSSITSLVAQPYGTGTEPGVEELLSRLSGPTAVEGIIAPLGNITVLSYTHVDRKLILDMGREYNDISGIRELLTRASLVRTMCQLTDIEEVELTVGGTPLVGSSGEPIGTMRSKDFVDYFGGEQDSLIHEVLTVYYVSADGTALKRQGVSGYYENTISREQAVIRFMQEDLGLEGFIPAIPPSINIINIVTTNGICYLDMDMSFFDPEGPIPYNVALAAIVNSLCELSEVHSVNINIIEPAESVYYELAASISGSYERNNDLVIN